MMRILTISNSILLAAEAEISLDEQQNRLREALREQFGLDEDGCARFWVYEAFPEYVIARGPEAKLYRIPYTQEGDSYKFGDAQEVTTAYVPVAEACAFVAETEAGADNRFPIVVMQAGWARGFVGGQAVPHYYPPEFVKLVAESLATGSKPFGRRHPDQKGPDPTGALDPDRIAGWVDGGSYDASKKRALAYANLLASEADLSAKLNDARKNNKLDMFGTSALMLISWKPGVIEGKQCLVAESLANFYSVDLCARGGAGGQFLTANADVGSDVAKYQGAAISKTSTAIKPGSAVSASRTEGATMKETLRKMLDALRKKNADRAAELSLKFATAAEADYPGLIDDVTAALADGNSATAVAAEAATALADAKRIQSRNRIETKLAESKLPESAKKLVRKHLETALAAEADLSDEKIDAEISATREAFAAHSPVGRVQPGRLVTLDSSEKLALAMEAALGVKESMGKGVAPFRGLREAYITITGDHDFSQLSHGGGFTGFMTAAEAVATTDFPNLLLNSLTKRLLQDYTELQVDNLELVYTVANISDYKSQDRVREGYFSELDIVAENDDYTEIEKPTDERVTYSLQVRGNLLSISERTIRNDDLGAISRFPARLARAARKTLLSFITNMFASNPTYGADSVAWFHASHNNLGTAALSADALSAARLALRRQTEKDSDEPLGLNLSWIMVPPELESTAIAINQTNTAGSNAFYHAFGNNNERIIVNAKLTDPNDWYYGAPKEDVPCIEIGFLDGVQQPQIFLANQPTVGKQFTTDQLQYKVKFPFGGAVIDFRGVGKNVVA